MIKFFKNSSIHNKFKMGSMIILASFIVLVVVNTFYFMLIGSYTTVEKKSTTKISKNIKNILNINEDTQKTLNNTANLIEKNADSLELFEFIGSINSHLISILLNPTQKEQNIVINMIKSWNENNIKNNKDLSKYYKGLAQNVKSLNQNHNGADIKKLQLIFDDMYSTLIDKAYDSSDNINAKVKELKNKIDTSKINVVKNLKLLQNIKVKREETKQISHIVVVIFLFSLLTILGSLLLFKKITITLKNDLIIFQRGLKNFFEYVSNPSKNIELINLNKKDEISLMAKEINKNIEHIKQNLQKDQKMIQEVASVTNKIKDGYLNVKIENTPHNESLKDLKNVINEMLKNLYKDISNILSVLSQYSNYNYKPEVNIETNGEIKQLAKEINHLRNAIVEMLAENNNNSKTLQDTAKILLENVSTLNLNSNTTSKNLEEIVENLKNISNSTQNNTKIIAQMADFSLQLKTSATKGKELANHTLESMNTIGEEINFIDETISLIDNIAFQTNILSLNAAVEAATAGDAGKGFAVVANEVRNLANKTLEASYKIKETVKNAVEKANNGKIITEDMIFGYENLFENINQTLELIGDTRNRSIKQLSSIKEIDITITNLNDKTKQNKDIAKDTNDIAIETKKLSQKIVKSLDEKVY